MDEFGKKWGIYVKYGQSYFKIKLMNIPFPQILRVEKHVFQWKNWNFEPTENSAQTRKCLVFSSSLYF